MTQLWPRLSFADAGALFATEDMDQFRTSHPSQTYAPVGGHRVSSDQVEDLRAELIALAKAYGYPTGATASDRVAFDRAAAFRLAQHMDLSWAEASAREIWNFLALVPLATLTDWRFGKSNRERWIASDLTRHTWARLWWHAVVFKEAPDVLAALSESDLNQLLERRAIGGDTGLTIAMARAVIRASADGDNRRFIMRDSTARLRRRLAFMDTSAMSDDDLHKFCSELVSSSVQAAISGQPNVVV